MYKTQKARGLEAGWALSGTAGYGYKVPVVHGVYPHVGAPLLRAVFKKSQGKLFARPCPVVPRHGFVESREVASYSDFEAVVKETLAEEAEGEVILMDRLSGQFSGIMTATGVTWGKSNDGVTGGKGEQRLIPTPAAQFDNKLLPYLGVKAGGKEGVYVELVEDAGHVCVVQMRLGPKQPDSRLKRICQFANRIMQQIITTGDITNPDDLIAWDALLKSSEKRQNCGNTLVWLPGQSLSSHMAVQAIANGYNLSVESTCPVKIGDILRADTNEMAQLGERDYAVLAKYFRRERHVRFWDFPRDVLLSVGTLHSIPYWGNEPHLLALRARGAVLAARYGLAACLGEARHKLREGDGETGKAAQVPWEKLLGEKINIGKRPSRGYVFIKTFAADWRDGPMLAKAAAEDMVLKNHPKVTTYLEDGGKLSDGQYAASFMGMKWEWAALRVHDLYVAIDRFIKDPKAENWQMILGYYNEIINASHNGGYLLNKWVAPVLIDNVATAPSLVFGYQSVMQLVWNVPAEKPVVVWVPAEMAPKDVKKTHHVTVDGALVPKKVWAQYKQDCGGLLCDCNGCLNWASLGKLAMCFNMPVYVKGEWFSFLPDLAESKTGYGLAQAATLEEQEPEHFEPIPPASEYDDGEEESEEEV